MPEYSAIIKQLTQKQKLRLLADINVLDEPEYRNMGIPPLTIDDNGGEGVFDGREQRAFSPAALAETWDVCRMQSITQVEAREQRGRGMTLASVPAPKSRIGLYSEGVSEEPLISMEVARAYRRACAKNSLPFVTHGLCLDARDAAWMGAVPDRDTAEEALLRPTRELHEGDDCAIGLMLRTDPRFPAYEEVALSVAAALPREQAVFCRCKRPEDTVRLLQEGYVLIGGNESALSTALQRDKTLRKDMERGRDVHERLEQVTADHEAISEEVIDAALKRVLDVAFRAKHCYESAEKVEDAPAQTDGEPLHAASVATTVMLRNQGMLPLEPMLNPGNPGRPGRKPKAVKPRRIVQIGDPFPIGGDERSGAERFAVRMQENGVPIDGYAPGYDPTSPDGGGEHLEEARALAESADVILLCLGGRQPRVGRELPPNQLLLADRLRSCAAHIVAIVVGDEPFDTGFASEYAGLFRVSSYAEEAVDALADVLCGRQDPGGRLAVTLYADSEKRMEARRLDVSRYHLKTGSFFGYRAYPDSGIPIDGKIDVASSMAYTEGFSFGYGLSYAKVTYADLRVVGGEVSFTVVNRSNREAVAVPQLYVSKPDSVVLRPREQLCGWEHLTLQPLERRIVSIPLRLPEVLDPHSGQYAVEGGTYILRLGTSSSDTLMERRIQVTGTTPAADGKKLYEYWASESNILQDGYTLEARYKMKKRSPKHICLALILLGLAVGVRFFSFDRGEDSLFVNIAAGVLLLCALVCCVFELVERNREKQRLIREVCDLNDRFFETAEAAPLTGAATMFSKETAEDVTQKVQEERSAADTDDDEMHTIDKTFTLADAAADLVAHAKTCGYSLEKDDARELLAAMSSSHLLMTQHMSTRQVAALQEILCSYFGTVADNASVGEAVSEETDLLLTHTGGDIQPSPLFLAIERARNKPDTPVIFRLTGVCPEGIPACIAPFVRFAGSPLTCNVVHAPVPGRAEQNLKLPSNFWLLIRPRPGYCKRMAAYVAEVTAVISCRVEPYMATLAEDARRLTYWQFKYLFEKARDEMNVREDRWKQIDRLVAAVSGLGGLSNRTVTGIEQYVATFCACGGEEDVALDRAMVSRLILPLEGGFERSHTAEDVEPSGLIDSIFGEDSLPASYQLAKWIEHGELMDPGDEPEETPEDTYGDTPTETYEGMYGDTPTETYEDMYGDTPTETYEDMYGDTPTETYEDTYGDTPAETYEDTYGDTPAEDYPEDAFRTDAEPEDEQTETQV